MTPRRLIPLAVAGAAVLAPSLAAAQCGGASWYAIRNTTASGEMMNPDAMTAAHPSLPFGTVVKVVNQRNGRTLALRINDRGPYSGGRIIDVSRAAASELGFRRAGTAKVCLEVDAG